MADQKISDLAAASALTGTELVELVQGGVNKRTTTQDIADLGAGGGGTITSVNGDTGPVVVLGAADIGFTPSGGISATNVDGALNELDSEKQTAAQVASSVAAVLATTITNGDTTHAPDGNSVFDALALKADLTAVIGIQDLFIPATAFWPRITNGSGPLTQFEIATSLFNIQALPFDQTTQEFAQFQIVFPRKYNLGTVTVVPYWTATSGSGTVQWGISGGAYSNDDALTVALGSAQTSDDTLLAANDLHIGPETAAITLAGTPASADFLALQISRNPGSDTLSADALLLGVSVRITTNAAKDQ